LRGGGLRRVVEESRRLGFGLLLWNRHLWENEWLRWLLCCGLCCRLCSDRSHLQLKFKLLSSLLLFFLLFFGFLFPFLRHAYRSVARTKPSIFKLSSEDGKRERERERVRERERERERFLKYKQRPPIAIVCRKFVKRHVAQTAYTKSNCKYFFGQANHLSTEMQPTNDSKLLLSLSPSFSVFLFSFSLWCCSTFECAVQAAPTCCGCGGTKRRCGRRTTGFKIFIISSYETPSGAHKASPCTCRSGRRHS